MVKKVVVSNLCNLAAEDFWALRMDVGARCLAAMVFRLFPFAALLFERQNARPRAPKSGGLAGWVTKLSRSPVLLY